MERIKRLKEFLKDSPTDSFLQHALALEYMKIGNDAEARQLFEEVLARDPMYVGSYYQLAKLLERTGENEAAIQWYEQGMSVAKAVNDKHAYDELQAAYEELVY